MSWSSGPAFEHRADGRTFVHDYEISQDGDVFVATLRSELTEPERHFTVRTVLRSDSLGALLVLVGSEVIRRETIRQAWELGQARIAEMKAFAALRDEHGDVPYPADG